MGAELGWAHNGCWVIQCLPEQCEELLLGSKAQSDGGEREQLCGAEKQQLPPEPKM